MPTKKPRLAVSLSIESRKALEEFSEASGIAASAFIASIVHDSIPIIQAMTRAYKIARDNPRNAAKVMEDVMVSTMSHAAQTQLQFNEAASKKPLRKRPRTPADD